jgi:hypothetical protein
MTASERTGGRLLSRRPRLTKAVAPDEKKKKI